MLLVDTNILAYMLIEGDRTQAVQQLFARDPDWCSEAFVMVEFSNILATCVRHRTLTQAQGVQLLTDAHMLLPTLHNVAHDQAFETAMQFGISASDARLITLARQLKSKLITEDANLHAAVPAWTLSLADALALFTR